jgi:argininosuccinate lyase
MQQNQALPYEITLITNNLPSGYHRDLQLLKEIVSNIQNLQACLDIAILHQRHKSKR